MFREPFLRLVYVNAHKLSTAATATVIFHINSDLPIVFQSFSEISWSENCRYVSTTLLATITNRISKIYHLTLRLLSRCHTRWPLHLGNRKDAFKIWYIPSFFQSNGPTHPTLSDLRCEVSLTLLYSGPIVRIRPDIIHISDPNFLSQVYGISNKRRNKYKLEIGALDMPFSLVGTLSHDIHRLRRTSMNVYFSKSAIRKSKPLIQRILSTFMTRLARTEGEVVTMDVLSAAATSDIIYAFVFGYGSRYLERDDLNAPFYLASREGSAGFHFVAHLPVFHTIIKAIPLAWAIWVKPLVALFWCLCR